MLRPLLPVLLTAAAAEMFIGRVLAGGGIFWIRRLDPKAHRWLDGTGQLTFSFAIIMALGVLMLLGFVSMRLRFWPAPMPIWLGPCLVVFALWSPVAAFFPRAMPLYHGLALLVAISMLGAYFGAGQRASARSFAVLLSASLACSTYGLVAESRPAWDLPWKHSALQSAELLALACGAVAVALLPSRTEDARAFSYATMAAIPPGLYLLLGLRTDGTGSPPWDLGWMRELPLPDPFARLVYSGVMFLFLFAMFRALGNRHSRVRGYGLAFLFLAGIHHRIAYQHLLGLIGLVLLTGGAPVEEPAEISPAANPANI